MARLWSCGFELQSVATGVEFDSVTGSPTINTTTKRSGAASLRVNPTAAAHYFTHQYKASDTSNNDYLRFYLRIASATNTAATAIALFRSSVSGNIISIRLNTNNTLELWNEQSSTQLGSDSPALSTNTWYRIELANVRDAADSAYAYIDGVEFAHGLSTFGASISDIRIGAIDSCTADFYIDDVAVNNDAAGAGQTNLPGEGSIVHMQPDGAGDNTQWQDDASAVQGTSVVGNINEVIPDDVTNYNKRTTNAPTTTPIDDWTVESASSAGIASTDKIKLVTVGVRAGATSATSTARSIKTRIKSASGGTTTASGSTDISQNGWLTHKDAVPRVYQLTSYTDPTTAVAWTPTGTNSLDNMQIGYQADVSSANEIRVTTIWALVEYASPQASPSSITIVGTGQVGTSINGGDVTLTFDGTPAQNDVVILFGGNGDSSQALNDPSTSGYSRLFTSIIGNGVELGVWYKILGASPDATVTGHGSGNAADGVTYASYVLRGVNTTTLLDTAIAITQGSVNNSPAITTITDNAWVIAFVGHSTVDSTVGTVSGYSNQINTNANDANDITIAGATKELTTAAAEDPGAWSTLTAGTGVALTMAIRPTLASSDKNITVSDAITITESVDVLRDGARDINKSDTITITESIGRMMESYANKSDTITITENVQRTLESNVNKSDTITVTESIGRLLESNVDKSDTITTTESVAAFILTLFVTVSDTITVTENVKSELNSFINKSDTITITENAVVAIETSGDMAISVSDTITVTESVGRMLQSYVAVSDTATVTESARAELNSQITVSDTITLTEALQCLLTSLISVSDTATITENKSILIPELYLAVSDTITVTESIGKLLTSFVNKSDTITVTESVATLETSNIAVSDTVTVTESTNELLTSFINKSDTITVTESVSLFRTPLYISVSDTITVTENVGVTRDSGGISVSDTVTTTEAVQVTVSSPQLAVTDTITITEAVAATVYIPPEALEITLTGQPMAVSLLAQPMAVTLMGSLPNLTITLEAQPLEISLLAQPMAVTLESDEMSVTLS